MAYPTARFVALVDGNSQQLKLDALDALPDTDFVLKTYDQQLKRYAIDHFRCEAVATFVSFTSNASGSQRACHVTLVCI